MKPSSYLYTTALIASLQLSAQAADSDKDGLDDSVETNTGIYVSPTDTGTDPTKPDSDGDGVGDWYEVATIETDPDDPQPNTPNDKDLRPNIPYPLPVEDEAEMDEKKPVKVYILSGQSNMVGIGLISPLGTPGTLETITKTDHKFPSLLKDGEFRARTDVMYRGVITAEGNAPLAPGQGARSSNIGPELGFGYVMGYLHDEPVLVLKTSQGGRALGWEILPPGRPQFTRGTTTFAGYGESPQSWKTGTTPVPVQRYAGYQFDQYFLDEDDWHPNSTYDPVTNVTDVLDNFATEYPQWADRGFEIAGFAWWQGWNDGLSYTPAYAYRYEEHLALLIKELRKYYGERYPGKIKENAPFVVATSGTRGWDKDYVKRYPTRQAVIDGQKGVSDPEKHPEFAGNVKTVETRGFWREDEVSPSKDESHYKKNAETYLLVGHALGRGMIDLVGFDGWINEFGLEPEERGFDADPDGDGLSNGLESLMGTNPNSSGSGIRSISKSFNRFQFEHPRAASPPPGIVGSYEWSMDMKSWHSPSEQVNGIGVEISAADQGAGTSRVTARVTRGIPKQVFVRLVASRR